MFSRSPFAWLKDQFVLWRYLPPEVAQSIRALRVLPFLTYTGRRLNGNGSLWRSFHFAVNETDWVVILHDQGKAKRPWVIFIERRPGTESGGRFANFERFTEQLPVGLRAQVEAHAAVFPHPNAKN